MHHRCLNSSGVRGSISWKTIFVLVFLLHAYGLQFFFKLKFSKITTFFILLVGNDLIAWETFVENDIF